MEFPHGSSWGLFASTRILSWKVSATSSAIAPASTSATPAITSPGLFVAAGFCGHGFAIGPVVEPLLAGRRLDGGPSLDLSAFPLDRFRA